jgi:hypothetical protein
MASVMAFHNGVYSTAIRSPNFNISMMRVRWILTPLDVIEIRNTYGRVRRFLATARTSTSATDGSPEPVFSLHPKTYQLLLNALKLFPLSATNIMPKIASKSAVMTIHEYPRFKAAVFLLTTARFSSVAFRSL